jgi:hypothetical protein
MEAGSKFKPGEFYKQVKAINPDYGGLTHGQLNHSMANMSNRLNQSKHQLTVVKQSSPLCGERVGRHCVKELG